MKAIEEKMRKLIDFSCSGNGVEPGNSGGGRRGFEEKEAVPVRPSTSQPAL